MSKNQDAPPQIEDAIAEHRAREEFGIRTHTMGTWFPTASYRPVPIVWFGGALVFQLFSLAALIILLQGRPGLFLAATAALSSYVIGWWTWDRGMSRAGAGWKALTLAMLAGSWLWVALAALS
mgnify:CR=1 FL=1